MRPTADGLMPVAFAMLARLQCVAFGGDVFAVFANTLSFTFSGKGGLRDGRVLSRLRPSTPSSM